MVVSGPDIANRHYLQVRRQRAQLIRWWRRFRRIVRMNSTVAPGTTLARRILPPDPADIAGADRHRRSTPAARVRHRVEIAREFFVVG
jgi:hypothetical protein